jgi:hypothetical protein
MTIPRYLPDDPLPPYTYIPGRTAHPISDPAGHLFGTAPEVPPPIDPKHWQESRVYLRGIDLFNHGFYWEAHEMWEGLWHAAGREGTTADFLKGLIKLAAAGVKVRQGMPRGVLSHARGAGELFQQVAATLGSDACYLGLRLCDLCAFAAEIERLAPGVKDDGASGVRVVFSQVLRPSLAGAP